MVNEDVSALCLVALFCISSAAIFVSVKAWRDRNLRSIACLLIDFMIVAVFPIILRTWIWIPPATMQRLFLSGFLFFLTIDFIYLLSTSNAIRLLIPLVSLYLLLAMLLLSLKFLSDPLGFGFVLFAYNLLDEIALATLAVSFLAVLLPLLKQIRYKIRMQLDSRTLDNAVSASEAMHGNTEHSTASARQNESVIHQSSSPLWKAVKLLKVGEYRHCIEFCDAELERIILLKFRPNGLFPAEIDQPISLRDQVSKLRSTEASIPSEDILQLRELRNSLTTSSQEATAHQAKWAIRLVRRTRRVLLGSNPLPNHSRER